MSEWMWTNPTGGSQFMQESALVGNLFHFLFARLDPGWEVESWERDRIVLRLEVVRRGYVRHLRVIITRVN